jgi:hypothetical protein
MANITASRVMVHPSYTVPEKLLQYNQVSGAFDALAGANPLVRLGEGDLYVYIDTFDIRTTMSAGQSEYNSLPSVSVTAKQISTPTYLQRVRAEYDHHDIAAGGQWGVSIPEVQRLGMRQGHFQLMRTALLYGFNGGNGEGLLNTSGATAVNLPPDSYGNTTVATYDNGQMSFFLLSQISAMKTRTMQLGEGHRIVVLGPQRILGAWEYQDIVQLTQFQRVGAGSLSTAGVVKAVGEMTEDEIMWCYDDTLIGKGAGGTDAVLVVMPEVKRMTGGRINTNEFAELAPGLPACTLQYCDMAAPREIPTPIAGGAIDVLSEMRITSGWGVRPEAVCIVSMQYS